MTNKHYYKKVCDLGLTTLVRISEKEHNDSRRIVTIRESVLWLIQAGIAILAYFIV